MDISVWISGRKWVDVFPGDYIVKPVFEQNLPPGYDQPIEDQLLQFHASAAVLPLIAEFVDGKPYGGSRYDQNRLNTEVQYFVSDWYSSHFNPNPRVHVALQFVTLEMEHRIPGMLNHGWIEVAIVGSERVFVRLSIEPQ